MIEKLITWLWGFSAERQLLIRTVRKLVIECGGAVVITIEDMEASTNDLELYKNSEPEGIRILVRGYDGQ